MQVAPLTVAGHELFAARRKRVIKHLLWRSLKPKYDFEEGLKETVNWYLNNEWWWKPLINDRVLHPTPWKLKW